MPKFARISLVLALCSLATALAAEVPPVPPGFPPLPSELPVNSDPAPALPSPALPQNTTPLRRPRITVTHAPATPAVSTNLFRNFNAVRPPSNFQTYHAPPTVTDDVLAFDAVSKEYNAKPGELAANFSFSLTNRAKTNVVINWVRPSCGCTVAKLPPTPWTLAPGEHGNIDLTVDLRGKFGTLSKYVNIDTSAGQKLLNLKIVVPTSAAGGAPGMDARARNMQMAMADRQAVFRGSCASCHVTPAIGKTGKELYTAACAICHDAPHRATMVPDLRALKNVTGKEFWAQSIANGKPGSLMPAFAKVHGGPLNDAQIASLAEYLDTHFPKNNATASAAPASSSVSAAGK